MPKRTPNRLKRWLNSVRWKFKHRHSTPHPLDRAVIPLGVKRIVIDAGHGGKQPGAISESGVSEKDITLDIALRVHRLLDNAPFEVLMTRQDDRTMTLEKRVAFANSNRADLFISIHINWTEPREIRPLETYFVGPSDDPATIKLASMENQESGYSLSEYRRVLEKIYIDTRRDESRTLAKNIHAELYQALKAVNPTLDNRGVRTAPFLVLCLHGDAGYTPRSFEPVKRRRSRVVDRPRLPGKNRAGGIQRNWQLREQS